MESNIKDIKQELFNKVYNEQYIPYLATYYNSPDYNTDKGKDIVMNLLNIYVCDYENVEIPLLHYHIYEKSTIRSEKYLCLFKIVRSCCSEINRKSKDFMLSLFLDKFSLHLLYINSDNNC